MTLQLQAKNVTYIYDEHGIAVQTSKTTHQLTNWIAQIVSTTDGAHRVIGKTVDGVVLPAFEVPVSDFGEGAWVKQWGEAARVYKPRRIGQVMTAIQLLTRHFAAHREDKTAPIPSEEWRARFEARCRTRGGLGAITGDPTPEDLKLEGITPGCYPATITAYVADDDGFRVDVRSDVGRGAEPFSVRVPSRVFQDLATTWPNAQLVVAGGDGSLWPRGKLTLARVGLQVPADIVAAA